MNQIASIPPSAFMTLLPWLIVGLLIVFGGLKAAFDGLPFQTKREAKLESEKFQLQMKGVIEAQAKTSENLDKLTSNVTELANLVTKVQTQVEDDRRHRDQRKRRVA